MAGSRRWAAVPLEWVVGIEAELRAEFDRWERKETAALRVLPYVLLAVCTLVALLLPLWDAEPHLAVILGLSAAAAVWLLWFHTLHRNAAFMGLYYAVLMVLAAGLVVVAPWYGLFAFIGYPQAFHYLRGRWRYAGAAATSMITAVSYLGGIATIRDGFWWAWLAISLISTVLAWGSSYLIDMADQRNVRQKQALAELHEANAKVEAALEENAGLHAQLLVQAREAGVLDERQRMAREIHDTLAQGLTGILTQLQAAQQTLEGPPSTHRHVTNAINLARDSLTEARRTVHAVEPDALAKAHLPEAITDVARRWSQVYDIDATLTVTGDPRPMHADVEVALLRAAQEALANVAKHAQATRVALTLSYMEDQLTLDVRDDGIGFDPDIRRAPGSTDGGFGLTGMRQRVQRLAGHLDIESEPGAGTAISASVPALPARPE
ncbi:sensor histidine kinase [Actinoplanes sp. Pm04-4]|uniref:Oxygen sensor histidine kinase NreB n=1 Tax=Paractinoplanes pyxinae TaxID=2997416 RepID=A0ABT4BGH2_9ACTN|nr:sensor histidine kinase [Actinoplanes pyxinae]MCY1145546.1 sensor histidine kinase [Actinoplanes pyxinae]